MNREKLDRYRWSLKDPESRLYILLKDGQVGTCTVDLSTTNYFYGLAISWTWTGKGCEAIYKTLVNQLIEQNDKAFQIAEDSNVAAKRLYERSVLSNRHRYLFEEKE